MKLVLHKTLTGSSPSNILQLPLLRPRVSRPTILKNVTVNLTKVAHHLEEKYCALILFYYYFIFTCGAKTGICLRHL